MNIWLQDVAWVPSWLQNLRTDGLNEYVKESQAPSNHAEKVRISLSKFTLFSIFICMAMLKKEMGQGCLAKD
jgi:hypothetical protein